MTKTSTTAGTNKPGNETSGAATSSAEPSGATERRDPRTVTVDLPFVTATFRQPEIHLPRVRIPNRQEVVFAAQTVQSFMPPPRQAVYFGGLAVLAAFEVIEWPVALAIGAGTALMKGSERHQPQPKTRTQSATTATQETTTATKRTESTKAGGSSSGRSAGIPPSS
jgi:short subunit dehydrogenase-like uncharacterized protein